MHNSQVRLFCSAAIKRETVHDIQNTSEPHPSHIRAASEPHPSDIQGASEKMAEVKGKSFASIAENSTSCRPKIRKQLI